MQAMTLPDLIRKTKITFMAGLIFRLGVACLPLLAVILLCFMMFSGWLRAPKAVPNLTAEAVLIPPVQAALPEAPMSAQALITQKAPILKAAFERLNITHATIRVPD
jgi:hypothetical protein